MNKAILMSIRPQYVAKILNGEKTIEIRKKFPKDYVGWVYIYCTKNKPNLWLPYEYDCFELDEASQPYLSDEPIIDIDHKLNGKVVGRFWCDKVETIEYCGMCYMVGDIANTNRIANQSCLDFADMKRYLGNKKGYAIHISKVEVFDKPKELKEFYKVGAWKVYQEQFDSSYMRKSELEIMEELGQMITKAPQSWQFIEDTQ